MAMSWSSCVKKTSWPWSKASNSHLSLNKFNSEVSANGSKRRTLQRRRSATHVQGREYPGECRQGHAGSQGPQRGTRQELRRPHRHQGRRVGSEGNRTQGQVREHGRADGERGHVQHLG